MRDLLGKWFVYIVFVLCASPVYASPEASVDVRSIDGSPLSTVGVGVPFQVIVTMRNCTDHAQVEIDDTPFEVLRRVSIQTRIINGKSSVSYVYSARIDNVGHYVIGPVHIHASGIVCKSNTCSIEVSEQEKVVNARFIMKIFCDDDVLYLGQETVFRLRIYSVTSMPEIESVHVPKIDSVSIGELRETSSGTEYVDKTKYYYKEFSASFSAHKIGTIVIPAHSIDVRDDQRRRGGFGFFFSAIAPTKQIYSNSLTIEVRGLPLPADKSTALIGNYDAVTASLQPDVVHVGQAVRYKLTLSGSGNALKVQAPLLSDISSTCKYYDSSVTTTAHGEVVFEYIIQPFQDGAWEIPSQEITYFDPKQKAYYTLVSNPVLMTVLAIQQGGHTESKQEKETTKDGGNGAVHSVQQFHPDLCAERPLVVARFCMPWFWYWLLIGIVILMLCSRVVIHICIDYYNKHYLLYRSRSVFYRAHKTIDSIEKTQKSSQLYDFFVTFFSDWFMVEKAAITECFIRERLLKLGFISEAGLESWDRFWYKIIHEQYGIHQSEKIDKTLYAEVRLWIAAFSKIYIR